MHKTRAFKTCDGKLFDDEAEAAMHEAKLKIGQWAERRGIDGDGMVPCDAVAKAMIDDAEMLAHLFVSLVRSLPITSELSFIDTSYDDKPLWRANGVNGHQIAS